MISFTKQDKARAYSLLSGAEKQTAFSESIADKITLLTIKYGLNEDDSNIFKFSIGLYILKLITLEQLPEVLTERFPGKPISNMVGEIKNIVFPEIERVKAAYVPEITEEASEAAEGKEVKPIPSPYSVQEKQVEKNINDSVNRADILKEIESGDESTTNSVNPSVPVIANDTTPKNSIEERLKGIVFTPKESKSVDIQTSKKQTIPASPIESIPRYTGADPYRESI